MKHFGKHWIKLPRKKMTHKNHYDEAFSNFTSYLDELLNDFRAIKLSSLLNKYIDLLVQSGLEKDTANNCVAQRLKDCIIKHYGRTSPLLSQVEMNPNLCTIVISTYKML